MEIARLQSHYLIDRLRILDLPTCDYAVFGSAPMWAHGLKELNDLDILARGLSWSVAMATGKVFPTQWNYEVKVVFESGGIEIFNRWGPGENWDTNSLIDTATIIDGIPFVTLENVLEYKRIKRRGKDLSDIQKIEDFLKL